jgi:uncharacterized protein YidB (DUF937 family)
MGLLDSIENMAGRQAQDDGTQSDAGTQSKVAGGLMQALDEHPGGLAGVLDSFKQNGMEGHVQGWATGQQPSATPEQVQQGLGGTGLIERVAEKAGVSPQVAQGAMATVLPMVVSHFTQGGQTAPPQSGFGGMASQILGKFV